MGSGNHFHGLCAQEELVAEVSSLFVCCCSLVAMATVRAEGTGRLERAGSVSSQLSILSHTSALFDFNHHDIHASCPERIIICIDLAQEVLTTTVRSRERGEVSLLSVWKTALELFVYNKSALNDDHQFAIVILQDKANWFCDFNSDPLLVCKAINDLEAMEENYDSFDTASLYSIIYENCPPPPATETPLLPPPYVVRALLIYGRSQSLPVYRGEVNAHDELMKSPYFFLDILYAHEAPSARNSCTSIFDILSEMFPKPKALVLDWCWSATHLFNSFARLLSHPLQRPLQTNMNPKLD